MTPRKKAAGDFIIALYGDGTLHDGLSKLACAALIIEAFTRDVAELMAGMVAGRMRRDLGDVLRDLAAAVDRPPPRNRRI